MKSDFACDASKLSWELFETTGKICYYLLYANIENPPELVQDIAQEQDDGRDF